MKEIENLFGDKAEEMEGYIKAISAIPEVTEHMLKIHMDERAELVLKLKQTDYLIERLLRHKREANGN